MRQADGQLQHYHDLPAALAQEPRSPHSEWRIHYHVPIFLEPDQLSEDGLIQSTQADILATFQALQQIPGCSHLEIETYTWEVLPIELKTDLLTSIQREYQWTIDRLRSFGVA